MLVLNKYRGVIKFIGPTAFSEGVWYGLEMDTQVGKHEGMVMDVQYFVAGPKRGTFVKEAQLKRFCAAGRLLLATQPPEAKMSNMAQGAAPQRMSSWELLPCTLAQLGNPNPHQSPLLGELRYVEQSSSEGNWDLAPRLAPSQCRDGAWPYFFAAGSAQTTAPPSLPLTPSIPPTRMPTCHPRVRRPAAPRAVWHHCHPGGSNVLSDARAHSAAADVPSAPTACVLLPPYPRPGRRHCHSGEGGVLPAPHQPAGCQGHQ